MLTSRSIPLAKNVRTLLYTVASEMEGIFFFTFS